MAFTDEQLGNMLVNMASIYHHLTNEDNLKGMTGDALSYTGVKLAAMKASIIELKHAAHKELLEKEVLLGKAKAEAYYKYKKEHGSTAAGDMKYMDEDFIAAQREHNTAKSSYEQLKGTTADVHDLLEQIQTRIIDLGGQRKDERTH